MIRTVLCSIALVCMASASLACSGHSKQTQSCIEGTTWDQETQSCLKIINS